ncbi:MAG: ABC transporter ATP-binding protein [Candidatus Bipolaricaulota bacterium]|nr:ABC transporter ATP-binding protein [Candidatus Bipolaricaulota bacterium]MDW8030763.1 ABC transporter ATP-binding protein [Candidatus Bipolaricaulota bacterium]
MNEIVIETHNLTKRYGDIVAVDNLNLTIRAGEVFGILGPNGSGKTTTILMLLGLTEPTDGWARVLGFDPMRQPLEVKSRVGYLPDQVGFYDELTAWENLAYTAKLNGLARPVAQRRINEALERMGLADVADRRVGTFSRGMRQRLGVAEILLKHPQVIILDEPTLGLDPEAAREFLQIIRTFKEEKITVLLSSHLLHQVQAVCDRVGLFSHGKMVVEGTVMELARQVLGGAYSVHLRAVGPDLTQALQKLPKTISVQRLNSDLYKVEAQEDIRGEVARVAVQVGAHVLSLGLEEPSLDEIYQRYFQGVTAA